MFGTYLTTQLFDQLPLNINFNNKGAGEIAKSLSQNRPFEHLKEGNKIKKNHNSVLWIIFNIAKHNKLGVVRGCVERRLQRWCRRRAVAHAYRYTLITAYQKMRTNIFVFTEIAISTIGCACDGGHHFFYYYHITIRMSRTFLLVRARRLQMNFTPSYDNECGSPSISN